MKIDFNFQLTELSGKKFTGDANNSAKLLANVISMTNKGNAIKLFDWALKLYNKEPLELDEVDYAVLYALIETSEMLNVLCKAQMLKRMDEAKKSKK